MEYCCQSLLLLTSHGLLTEEGNGTPLQYSCLENPMDGGAWWAAVLGVEKSRTRLSNFTFTFHFHALEKEMATHSSGSGFSPEHYNLAGQHNKIFGVYYHIIGPKIEKRVKDNRYIAPYEAIQWYNEAMAKLDSLK